MDKKIEKELKRTTMTLTHKGELICIGGTVALLTDDKHVFYKDETVKCKKCGSQRTDSVPYFALEVVPLEIVKKLLEVMK